VAMVPVPLLLDEGVSPAIVPRLLSRDIDAVPLRDRGMLQAPDHAVWKYACHEDRTVVTVNGGDFIRLAKRSETHPSLLILPGGSTRDEQFDHIIRAVDWLVYKFSFMPTFRNYVVEIDDSGIKGQELVLKPPIQVARAATGT
jgi:predicted nuclease of predicted toxin-antitoxin system